MCIKINVSLKFENVKDIDISDKFDNIGHSDIITTCVHIYGTA